MAASIKIDKPNSVHEKEADKVAEQMLHSNHGGGSASAAGMITPAAPSIQRMPLSRNFFSASNSTPVHESILERAHSATGMDFSGVRTHSDSVSHSMNSMFSSRAFTYGSDIYLGRNESAGDAHLMSHELAHTAQQSVSEPTIQRWSVPVHSEGIQHSWEMLSENDQNRLRQIIRKNGREVSDEEMINFFQEGSAWNDMMEDATGWEKAKMLFKGGADKSRAKKGMHLTKEMERDGSQANASHHGAMMFLHAQAETAKNMKETSEKMIAWVHLCHEIAVVGTGPELTLFQAASLMGGTDQAIITGTIPEAFLKLPLGEFFFVDNYSELKGRAMGSAFHMIQDSFNTAHGQRTTGKRKIEASRGGYSVSAGKIKTFTDYDRQQDHPNFDFPQGQQGGAIKQKTHLAKNYRHSEKASNRALLEKTEGYNGAREAVTAAMGAFASGASWDEIKAFFDALFAVDTHANELDATTPNERAELVVTGYDIGELKPEKANLAKKAGALYNSSLKTKQDVQALLDSRDGLKASQESQDQDKQTDRRTISSGKVLQKPEEWGTTKRFHGFNSKVKKKLDHYLKLIKNEREMYNKKKDQDKYLDVLGIQHTALRELANECTVHAAQEKSHGDKYDKIYINMMLAVNELLIETHSVYEEAVRRA